MPREFPSAAPPSVDDLTPAQRGRREQIVKVAHRLLINTDYESIQIRDIANRAGVALGTVYRYFSSKEHLFSVVFQEWVRALGTELERHPFRGTTNEERLGEILHRVLHAFESRPRFYRVIMILQVTRDPYAQETYRQASSDTFAIYGQALSGLDPEVAGHLLRVVMALLDASIRSWVLGHRTFDQIKADVDTGLWLLFDFKDAPGAGDRVAPDGAARAGRSRPKAKSGSRQLAR